MLKPLADKMMGKLYNGKIKLVTLTIFFSIMHKGKILTLSAPDYGALGRTQLHPGSLLAKVIDPTYEPSRSKYQSPGNGGRAQ